MNSHDLTDRLDALDAYVTRFERIGKTAREFWAGFVALEGDLGELVAGDDAEPELRERFIAILAHADDAGYAVAVDELDRLEASV